jgi:uncharacterized protein (TIGR02466 family)
LNIIELFPQPVYQSQVKFTSEEVDFIHSVRNSTYPNVYGNVTSNDNFILNREELSSLKKQIKNHLDEYLMKVIGASGVTLEVTQSWLNFNDKNTSHHTHCHNNSIVSGVIYVSEEPSELIFFKENSYGITPKITRATKFNQDAVPMNVKQNMIVLFPSHMLHGVNVNKKDQARISLAFNSFYRGSLGDVNKLTNLEL